MDVEIDTEKEIIVNNRVVDQNYLVYENFNIEWTILSFRTHESDADAQEASEGTEEGADVTEALADENADGAAENENLVQSAESLEQTSEKEEKQENEETKEKADPETEEETVHVEEQSVHSVEVIINGTPVTLTGKVSYTFVDIFDFYEFDLSASAGRGIITKLNGQNAQCTAELKDGDEIVLAWKEK